MNPDLDFDEMEVITQLRKLREHGWGQLTVTVKAGEIKVIKKEEVTMCDNEQRKIFEEVRK